MIQRPLRPNFSFAERQELLKSMGRTLELSRIYSASIAYNSPQYRMADGLRDAIKALATDLTDDPDYYGHPMVAPLVLSERQTHRIEDQREHSVPCAISRASLRAKPPSGPQPAQ
jgi:hypothetical protein